MKKLILLLLFIPLVSFGQSKYNFFVDGYLSKNKKIKLLVMLFDKKHKWPTGWGYHILPWAIMFWLQYMQSEHYGDYINNLRFLIENK